MPIPDYNGASLVPDLSGSLRLALGIAQQHEQKQQQLEAAGLTDQVANTSGGLNILTQPENLKTLMRLNRLDPEAAKFAVNIANIRDQSALSTMSKQSEDASRTYQALLDIKDPAERNRFLASTIREKDGQGQDTTKLREMIGLSPDEQTLRARSRIIMAGDMKDLLAQQNEAVLKGLEVQDKRLKIMQTAQQMELARREDARKNADEGRKTQEENAKVSEKAKAMADANQQTIESAGMVNEQIDQVLKAVPKGVTGPIFGRLASLDNTGDTAAKVRAIDTLKSMLTLDKLMDMKRSSPTGASGLGSTSERELAALANSIANLDPLQDDKSLEHELEKVRNFFSGVSLKAGGKPLARGVAQSAQTQPQQVGRFVVVAH